MSAKKKRSRRSTSSRGRARRPPDGVFPAEYAEALSELRKPGLEVMFSMPKGTRRPTKDELDAQWEPFLADLNAHVDSQAHELRQLLETMPALQVLSALVVVTSFLDPERYRESETRYSAIHAEYPTWLYLTAEPRPDLQDEVLDSGDMQRVIDLLDDIAQSVQTHYTIQSQNAELTAQTDVDDILIRARNWHLFVRAPSYEHHHRRELEELFAPFDREIRDLLGFDVHDAVRFEDAVMELANAGVNEINAIMAEAISEWQAAIRDDFDSLSPDLQSLVARLMATDNPSEAAVYMAMTWAQTFWYTAFTVTPIEIAEASALEVDVVEAILTRFATAFGQTRRPSDWPSIEDRLEHAPLVNLGDGRWWTGLVTKFAWAIAPVLEEALKGSQHWERYQKSHRSQWLEKEAVALVAGNDPRVQRWTNLRYGDEELDGLVLLGGTALLIETKAGRMTLAARRGARSGIQSDLRELLSSAQDQLNRATEFLLAGEEARFVTAAGDAVVVRKSEIYRLAHIIVTLDPLDAFVTRMRRLAIAGVFDRRSLPWAVDINNLRICVDVLGSPARLVHYLDRRMRAAHRGVEAPEELDYLGHYMSRGLYFDELEDDVCEVLLTSHTEQLDDYYRHQAGARTTPAEKPRPRVHPDIADLISRLEGAAPDGFPEAIFWLLELSEKGQANLADAIKGRRVRASEGILTATRFVMGETVVAYVAVPDEDLRPLRNYLAAVKYLARVDHAIGICQSATNPDLVDAAVLYYEWEEDESLADLAKQVLATFTSSGTWGEPNPR